MSSPIEATGCNQVDAESRRRNSDRCFDEDTVLSQGIGECRERVPTQTIIESEGLPVISGDLWTLHGDGVCQALWFRRVKAEKTLAEIEPANAVTACQYFWTNEEFTPFNWTFRVGSVGLSAYPAGPAKFPP